MIITLKSADFSKNNINDLLNTFSVSYSGTGVTGTPRSIAKENGVATESLSATITIASNYTYESLTVRVGGNTLTAGTDYTVSGTGPVTLSIPAAKITGNVVVSVQTSSAGGDVVDPDEPTNHTFTINATPSTAYITLGAAGYSSVAGTGSASITVASGTEVTYAVSAEGYIPQEGGVVVTGTTSENIVLVASGSGESVTYGTLISNPSNLRGGAVDYIIVKPEFYTSILNKKITKIRVYKVADPSNASKTTIGIGKVALSGEFASTSQTVSGLQTAYSNISSYRTYDVASYTNKTMMELDCDITLSNGEYLCFETKNGHCVGYCNNAPQEQQMMYIYLNSVCPEGGTETSQHLPISVTVEE